MAKEKERFELLLEEVRDGGKLVAEGHSVIRREMQEMKAELKADIHLVDDKVGSLGNELAKVKQDVTTVKQELDKVKQKVEKIDNTLEKHVRQPAHVGL